MDALLPHAARLPRRPSAATHTHEPRRSAAMAVMTLLFLVSAVGIWGGCKKGTKPVPKPASQDLRRFIPDSVHGWIARGPGAQFDRETVFDVMNGGAEMYLDYHMERMILREYEQPGRPLITVHLFDMGSSEDAYGVFSSEREGAPVEVGQDADYADGLLRFWRGTFFASLQASRETKPAREALLALGRLIAGRIPTEGKRPDLLDRLPGEGQQTASLRFLRTWPTLDHHLRLGRENPLKLSRQTAVSLARYGEGTPALYGLVIRYPKASLAKEAAATLANRQEDPPVLARPCGNLLLAAVGGRDAETRQSLLDRIRAPECPAPSSGARR